jgi:DUF4097 and DUF4098 domain-containing protein YvlB
MSKITKGWLIGATLLTVIGCILMGSVMIMLKWDFFKLSTITYETNEHMIDEAFQGLSITSDTADIELVPSENGKVSVVCHEQTNQKHTVAVENGTLVVRLNDTRKWYEYIGIHFGTPCITVYLPAGDYGVLTVKESTGDVKISKDFAFERIDVTASTGDVTVQASATDTIRVKTDTGSIRVEKLSAKALDLAVSTGKVTLSQITCEGDISIKVSSGKTELRDVICQSLTSSGSTGSLSLHHVIATEAFTIRRSTGDVRFDHCDAATISVKTDTGDVSGTLLTAKRFVAETSTGSVRVPQSDSGGKCEIHTTTGDITITIP